MRPDTTPRRSRAGSPAKSLDHVFGLNLLPDLLAGLRDAVHPSLLAVLRHQKLDELTLSQAAQRPRDVRDAGAGVGRDLRRRRRSLREPPQHLHPVPRTNDEPDLVPLIVHCITRLFPFGIGKRLNTCLSSKRNSPIDHTLSYEKL